MKIWIKSSLILLLLQSLVPTAFAADSIVAIVNRKSTLQKLTQQQLKAVFLGESRYAAPGVLIEIVDRERTSDIYKDFYASLVAMSPKEVSIYWAKKVFTGEAPPPTRVIGDDAAAIEQVKTKPNGISYIYEKNVTAAVKVIYELPQK
jgi:ABC-type phosphate transport system substrate-binding protein